MDKFIKLLGIVSAGLLIIVISKVSADDKSDGEKAKVVNTTIFKNGTALIRQEIKEMVDDKGWLRTSNVAPPILGTLNVVSEGADQVILEDIDSDEPITSLADIFEANIGKTVVIPEVNKEGVKTYRSEKIKAVLKKDEQIGVQPQPPMYNYYQPPASPIDNKLVVLESELGTRIVSVNNFPEFMGKNGQDILMTKKAKKTRLAIHMTGLKAREATVLVEYLTRGLRWIPAYRVDLTSKDKADLTLSAEVVNDLIDLDKTRIEFAGGFPHFLFDGQLSPVSLVSFWPAFSQFIAARSPQQNIYGANVAAQQAAPGYAEDRDSLGGGGIANIHPLPGITTVEGGDLHFYQLPALSLSKGKRGKFVLWQTNVPYEHCYTLEVNDAKKKDDERLMRERYGYYNNQPGITSEDLTEKVGRAWHILNLKNTGNLPWTMGPATAFENGRPLGQDVLYFAAPGTETSFYMAPAPHITYKYEEEVRNREESARMYQGMRYDLIKERGTLKITNNKAEAIKLKLVFHRGGEIVYTDNKNLTITTMAFEQYDWGQNWGNYEINAHSKISGELNLKAGEEVTIILERQYYQRG